MTIAIDASRAFVHERTGIEEYAYQLIKALRDPLQNAPVVLYARFGGEAAADPRGWIERHFFDLPDAWDVRVVRHRRLWTQWWLAWRLAVDRPDTLLVPAHTVPWIHPARTVVVVHGLEYEMTPQAYSLWARVYMRVSIRLSCWWARTVVAVSDNTRQDLMRLYRVPADRIVVVPEGVNLQCATDSQQLPTTNCQLPTDPYFLFIGRIEERKNIARIVAAFNLFKERTGLPHRLVLAGRPGYGYDDAAAAIAASTHCDAIEEKGFVSEDEKWQLLAGATAFVFPTLYEGFGLPVLEAQSVGVPVITSTVSSLPEVAGDGALLVDPADAEAIADAMAVLATDDDRRRAIIAQGSANIGRFGWDRCARAIAALLTA